MREDGSYVELKYDGALRLTNELYKTSGGSVIEEIGYAYDASGNRTKVVNASGTFTNGIAGGYRLLAVTNTSTGLAVENYGYDTGGRMTNMVRSGQNFTLGYNSADQVAQVIVTNGGATFHDYEYDGAGRRTRAKVNGTVTRKFMVAPTPGYDLESPLLVADGGNNFQMGYVYVDGRPTQRYASSGSASTVYYLEDGMGSVIGLVDASQSSVAVFKYDGFGQTRSATGSQANPPSNAGGDFRFHGGWLESATALYHFRARDYDPRTGRFTSRDSDAGSFRMPEVLSPYLYANSNPHVYTDPSGRFSLIEINIAGLFQTGEKIVRTAGGELVKARVRRQVRKFITEAFRQQISDLLAAGFKPLQFGKMFEKNVTKQFRDLICGEFAIPESIYLEVPIDRYGDPLDNGLNCDVDDADLPAGAAAYAQLGVPRPDFILSGKPPKQGNRFPKAWLIGEIKSSTKTVYNDYIDRKKPDQFDAIMNYAKKRTTPKTALFIVANNDTKKSVKTIKAEVSAQGIKKGAIALMIIILGK